MSNVKNIASKKETKVKVVGSAEFRKLSKVEKTVQVAEALGFLFKDLKQIEHNLTSMIATCGFGAFSEIKADIEVVNAKIASVLEKGVEVK